MTRRMVLAGLGGWAAWLARPFRAGAAPVVEIAMAGRADGSAVWFDPIGVAVAPGTTVRWTNRDPGNSHTATAYHPSLDGRQWRIPVAAAPWDSGYLLPGESFAVTLTVEGVYDYHCRPHEAAGMAGRIVVGRPGAEPDGPGEPPSAAALARLPPVERILARGTVRGGG